ncbi:MAG: exo-alpha-sialidase, partial [Armatimonadetes bacterium]|nr:exo-alpha-sialidase [Candidatus Hippobium faecium]
YLYESRDGGENWSGGRMVYTNERACYANAINVIDGKVYIYMIVHDGDFWNMKSVTIMSEDGENWRECPTYKGLEDWTLIRPMKILRDGTVLIPYHSYPVKGKERICRQGVLISKDKGRTFDNIICFELDQPEGYRSMKKETIDGTYGWIWTEPSVAELSDGSLLMFMRIDNTGWLWKSVSQDGGLTWTYPEKTDIPNSTCKTQLININNNRLALIHVPNNKEIIENGAFYAYRHPLEVWVSEDNGKTWAEKIRVTDFPGEYHYPNGFYKEGKLCFVIEHNRHTALYITLDL